MSQDVILGSTDRSWSRDSAQTTANTESSAQPLTDKERDRIEKLAKLEMLATRGDAAAQKKMVEVNAALAVLQGRAKKGDAKSKRILATLQESGLVTVSESRSGPKLVMAGAAGRTRRSRQKPRAPTATANPNQQVQEFLLNLKMRAMAGDPQAIAALQQYQQIIASPEGPPMQLDEAPAEPMPEQPQDYPPQETPMAGDESGYNSHWAYIRGLGEEEIALAREGGACERAALRRRF